MVPALTRHATVLTSDLVAEHLPMLREAVSLVGNVRVRNQGTFGGSIAHADPTAEIPLVTMVLGGEMVLLGPDGERTVPADELFRTYLTTAAGPGEVVTEVRLPSAAGALGIRGGGTPLLRLRDRLGRRTGPAPGLLRVGLGGVADRPVLVADDILDPLRNPEPDIIAAVADTIADSLDPEDDVHARGEHRRRLVRVHVRRALEQVLDPWSSPMMRTQVRLPSTASSTSCGSATTAPCSTPSTTTWAAPTSGTAATRASAAPARCSSTAGRPAPA